MSSGGFEDFPSWSHQGGWRARLRQPGTRHPARGTAFALAHGTIKGRTMALSVDPTHLKRYKDIARLLLKHGRGDLVERASLEDVFAGDVIESPELREQQ